MNLIKQLLPYITILLFYSCGSIDPSTNNRIRVPKDSTVSITTITDDSIHTEFSPLIGTWVEVSSYGIVSAESSRPSPESTQSIVINESGRVDYMVNGNLISTDTIRIVPVSYHETDERIRNIKGLTLQGISPKYTVDVQFSITGDSIYLSQYYDGGYLFVRLK